MKIKKQNRFMSLYKPNHEAFVRFCTEKAYQVMPSEDLVNETISRVYEKLDELKSDEAFLSYLFSVASNIIKNEIRRKKIIFYQDEFINCKLASDAANQELKLDIEILYQALSLLPSDQKESLILFEISGYSIKEIAILHNCKESAVSND